MVGTVVDYLGKGSPTHFIMVLSGEKVAEINLDSFPTDVKMGDQIEFTEGSSVYEILKKA